MNQLRSLVFASLFLLAFLEVSAQRPVITSINKTFSTVNDSVTITGSNFGTNAANLRVNFGAVQGQILSVSNTTIKVRVPAGTTYQSLAVTNFSSGLTGYSSAQFGLAFGGESFSSTRFAAQQDFAAGVGIFDLCLCDFDGDGLADAATSNTGSTDIGVYRNTSTISAINFAARQAFALGLPAPTRNVNCGDIDGDGKPDLVVSGNGTSYGNLIFVFRNTSTAGTISFAAPEAKTVSANGAARIVIRDLDLDGKPEVIVTNVSDSKISFFPNTSTVGSITFSGIQTVAVTSTLGNNGLSVEDLDADGLPEIIVNQNQTSNIYIFKNISTSGALAFQLLPAITTQAGLNNLAVGDLDNDGKPDIAVTNIGNNHVYIFKNQTTTTIQFPMETGATSVPTDTTPWSINLNDLDGDGKLDILTGHTNANTLNFFKNYSISGALSFGGKIAVTTAARTRSVKAGDLNGDGKPDLVFTNTTTGVNNLSVMKNRHCVMPKVTPAGPLTVCSDTPLRLQATNAIGVTYQWYLDGTSLPGETNAYIDPDQSGSYSVSITNADGCAKSSIDAVDVAIDGATLGFLEAHPTSPVCVGGTITLSATNLAGATAYKWTGPNSYSVTKTTNSHTIPNATLAMAGQYSVTIEKGACSSAPLYTDVVVHGLPSPTIVASGSTSFCEGGSAQLSVGTFSSYQWKKDNSPISGATSQTYTATASGNYSVVVTNSNGCTKESAAIAVNEYAPPVANFTIPAVKCVGEAITFTSTSPVEGSNVTYLWDFGDGNTSEEQNPSHAYAAINDAYVVKLIVSYSPTCKDEITKNIKIIEPPVLEIIAEGSTTVCAGDSVKLSGPDGFNTYLWSTGKTTQSIYAKKDGDVTLAVITNEGCRINTSINIRVLDFPEIIVSADKDMIKPGESTTLYASGGQSYSWAPAEGLSDPASSNPVATPNFTTTYTVTGTDIAGCTATQEITIVVDNKLSVSPPKLFVPDSDINWTIDQMEYYPECAVIIFNKQGLKLFENTNYSDQPWDGNYKGQPVPEGVYYYVIRCKGDVNDKTGSITIMRQ